MNMKRLFYVTLNHLRQYAFIFIALSLFVVLMTVEAKGETYEYDDLNRVTKVIYDDQSYTLYEYDANGNIKSQSYHEKEDSGDSGGGSTGGNGSTTGGNSGTGQGQQGDTDTSDQENPTNQHKNGMKAESGNATYVITSVKNKTASFYKFTNKKKKTYTVPDYVKIDGVKYKVTKISAKAFKNNKKLKKVTIGKNVTNIGKQAFYGCKNLKTIIVKTTKLKSVGKQAFKGIHKKAIIKVPRNKYEKYKKLLKGKGQKNTVQIKKR